MSAFDPKRTLAVRICRDAQCSLVMFAAILLRSLLDLQPTSERVAKLVGEFCDRPGLGSRSAIDLNRCADI